MIAYKTYEIVQKGKDLSCNEKIVINKYDNCTSRFHFTYDGTLEGNFYVAMRNPQLERYFIQPVIDGYYEITSEMSVYPGRWIMLLIVTDISYHITDDEFDQSEAIYVSNEFRKIAVHNNFLDEDDKDAIDPVQSAAINSMLNRLEATRNTFEVMATNAADAAQAAEDSETNCRNYNTNITLMYNQIVRMYNELRNSG